MARAASCLVLALGAAALGAPACSGKSDPPRAEPPPQAPRSEPAADRSVEPTGDPGTVPRVDREPAPPPGRPAAARSRPIDIVLRSSPPGATAAVDGVPIGPTPTYWSGEANGREHEFTFVLSGYAFARYRFVPITSGIVHARLEVLADDTDAGVPPEMMRVVPDAAQGDVRARSSPPARSPAGSGPAVGGSAVGSGSAAGSGSPAAGGSAAGSGSPTEGAPPGSSSPAVPGAAPAPQP